MAKCYNYRTPMKEMKSLYLINLTINNLDTTAVNIITLSGGSSVTIVGNPLIHPRDDASDAVSIGNSTFRFIITNITSASEAVTIVRL